MIRYYARPGVVLTSVCGENLLVAAKAAREHCPYFTQISESAAFLWEQLVSGADLDALERAVLREYEIENPASARKLIEGFIHQMLEQGYLLQKGDEHEE